MPIYEYSCAACNHEFEEIILGDEEPVCPQCGHQECTKLISSGVFRTGGPIVAGSPSANAVTSRGTSPCATCTASSCSTCG